MSFSVVDAPQTGRGGRAPKLAGKELASAVKALESGRAIKETVAKSRKNVQSFSHSVRSDLRAAMGLESADVASTTTPTPGHDAKSDDSWDLVIFLTAEGLKKVEAGKAAANGDAAS